MYHKAIVREDFQQDNISVKAYSMEGIERVELPCEGCSYRVENQKLKAERSYWQAMHRKAVQREARLKEEKEYLKAKLRLRERQLFGRKSEKNNGSKGNKEESDNNKRRRGQQPGSVGHGRRMHNHLSVIEEVYDIPQEQRHCSFCNLPYKAFPGTDDSEEIIINVKAHRRVIKRKRYKRGCNCSATPPIISAQAPPKLIPKGRFGISVWVMALIEKYLSYRPTYRLLENLKLHGIDIAQGTVTDGLKRIEPLFEPVIEGITQRNLSEDRWHADETRWLVFATIEGKVGYRWYMWVFLSESTVVYKLDPTRSSKVPKKHFAKKQEEGILIADRYSAYKTLLKGGKIKIAYCWAHVRRDFLSVAKDWPKQQGWAMEWVEDIGSLYHLNNERLKALEDAEDFSKADTSLREAVQEMAQKAEDQLTGDRVHPACRKVLKSLKNHWEGLTLFVEYPEVPMDNNRAERAERGPVLGRKNYYGSGSIWSGRLQAVMMSIFQTLLIWDINPQLWLTSYLQACAECGGEAPEDISGFLPWSMSENQRKTYSMRSPLAGKPEVNDTS